MILTCYLFVKYYFWFVISKSDNLIEYFITIDFDYALLALFQILSDYWFHYLLTETNNFQLAIDLICCILLSGELPFQTNLEQIILLNNLVFGDFK
jgi:hypothetical protein